MHFNNYSFLIVGYERTCQGLAMGASLLTFIGVIILIVKLCKGKEPGCTSAYPVSRVLFFIAGNCSR